MSEERKSGVGAYLTALIPGVGYLYLGLKKRGVQAFIIFILIKPVLDVLGLEFLNILKVLFWFYTFFDTINLAARMDRGEFVPDSDFIVLDRFADLNKNGVSKNFNFSNNIGTLFGGGLILLGTVSIVNKVCKGNWIYEAVKDNISVYFIPIIFVIVGGYLLFKSYERK
jgi:hypothetical protein